MTSLKISKAGCHFAGILLLGIGAVSFIMLFFHFLSLDEMADSIQAGYSHKGLLKMLWTTMFFHISFYIFGVLYFTLLLRAGSSNIVVKSVFREKIFISTHIIGVVCGILGILIALLFLSANERNFLHRVLIVPFGFVLFPYLLALGGWGYCFIKRSFIGSKR
ncbi:MAG: hypothetical protein HC905_24135 [Bacteroidales bacterium]|nr:hypothetical protein [Bacteroidales bacterium]